jgi:hypothetical protein
VAVPYERPSIVAETTGDSACERPGMYDAKLLDNDRSRGIVR